VPVVGQHGLVSWKSYNGSVLEVVLPWDHQTCMQVPDKGTFACIAVGSVNKDVCGLPRRVNTPPNMGISKYCSGHVKMAVAGTRKRVWLRRSMDIWRSSSGVGNKVVRGIPILVPTRPSLDI
jgi:hypothetical protein